MSSISDVTPEIIRLWQLRPAGQRRRIDVQSFINGLADTRPELVAPLRRGRGRPVYDPMMKILWDHFA